MVQLLTVNQNRSSLVILMALALKIDASDCHSTETDHSDSRSATKVVRMLQFALAQLDIQPTEVSLLL